MWTDDPLTFPLYADFGKRKAKTYVSASGSLQIKSNRYSTLPVYTYIYIYLYITTADVAVLQEEMRQFLIEKTKVTVIFKGQTAI